MKKVFFEYYPIDKETVDSVWDKGVFCYDANVLLNLFRYSEQTRDKVIESMEYFRERTVLPYQACYEYLRNRREVETDMLNSYDAIGKFVEGQVNALKSGEIARYRKHCALDMEKDIIKPLEAAVKKIIEKLEDKKSKHSEYLNGEATHNRITELFDGCISERFTGEELKKIYAEGKGRYERKVPPGFADYEHKKHEDENRLYVDLVIWEHLMEIGKKRNADVLFVTDDRKKDWWDIYQGQTKGPRPELYREFHDRTGRHILIYSVEDFINYSKERTAITVSRSVISEIEELRKVEERRHVLKSPQKSDILQEDINNLFDFFTEQYKTYENIDRIKEYISNVKFYDNMAKQIEVYNKWNRQNESYERLNKERPYWEWKVHDRHDAKRGEDLNEVEEGENVDEE
ncbi:MAG: PIN domain-containing protein [Rikenellaceae bacterium]|nr:PIN domain-containing protein [Rikenellaceae bacterium]